MHPKNLKCLKENAQHAQHAQHDGHTTKGIQDAVEYHLVTSAQALDLICSRLGAFALQGAPNNKRS